MAQKWTAKDVVSVLDWLALKYPVTITTKGGTYQASTPTLRPTAFWPSLAEAISELGQIEAAATMDRILGKEG